MPLHTKVKVHVKNAWRYGLAAIRARREHFKIIDAEASAYKQQHLARALTGDKNVLKQAFYRLVDETCARLAFEWRQEGRFARS